MTAQQPSRLQPRSVRLGLLMAAALFCAATSAAQPIAATSDPLPRHPLETQALTDPDSVLRALPTEIERARSAKDSRTLALLYLAQANACRVLADWSCQRDASVAAREAAIGAGQNVLVVRSEIAEARARMALQDFSRAERVLGAAELLLRAQPSAELSADVALAYSTMSDLLGKTALALEYADRGLALLGTNQAPALQVRLLRNRSRALGNLKQLPEARDTLLRAEALMATVNDPKLDADIQLELAQIAWLQGDIDAQNAHGRQALVLAERLTSSQIAGKGHEVLGLAAASSGDNPRAEAELRIAVESFRRLKLRRDELRTLRELAQVLIGRGKSPDLVEPVLARFLELHTELDLVERANAADDFDARLKYAEQELSVQRLESEAALAEQRANAAGERERLSKLLFGLLVVLLLVLAAFFVQQRWSNRRLKTALARLAESEHRLRAIADNIPALISYVDSEERYRFANAYAGRVFGGDPAQSIGRTVLQVRGAAFYADLKPHIHAALRGETVSFGGRGEVGERVYYYQTSYVPDRAPDGSVRGFFALTLDITELKLAELKLERLARHDSLTGLANRRQFEERLALALVRCRRSTRPLSLLCLDIDRFKAINDASGHSAGDEVLREFALRLRNCVREEDLVARLGGDEFLLLIEDAEDLETAENVAGKILAMMRQPFEIEGAQLAVTVSIGVAFAGHPDSAEALIEAADRAMYAAKSAGRNTYRVAEAVAVTTGPETSE